jgi:hypothetical protein
MVGVPDGGVELTKEEVGSDGAKMASLFLLNIAHLSPLYWLFALGSK